MPNRSSEKKDNPNRYSKELMVGKEVASSFTDAETDLNRERQAQSRSDVSEKQKDSSSDFTSGHRD